MSIQALDEYIVSVSEDVKYIGNKEYLVRDQAVPLSLNHLRQHTCKGKLSTCHE